MSKFTKWYEQKEFNENSPEEERLYTETQLRRDLKMKSRRGEEGELMQIYTGGRWKLFEFFKLKQAIPIRTRKKTEIKDIEITNENLCEALYIINKSAKISRDTKNKIMDKLIQNNVLKLMGYHKQGETYLKLYKYESDTNAYTFHMISSKAEIEGLKNLGNIDLISTEYKIKPKMKFNESINLLLKYLIDN